MEVFDHIIYTDEIIGIGPLQHSYDPHYGPDSRCSYSFALFFKNGTQLSIESSRFPGTSSGPYSEESEAFKATYEQHKSLIRALDLAKRRSDGAAWNQSNAASIPSGDNAWTEQEQKRFGGMPT